MSKGFKLIIKRMENKTKKMFNKTNDSLSNAPNEVSSILVMVIHVHKCSFKFIIH